MSTLLDTLAVSGNWVWPRHRVPLMVTNHGPHLYGTATSSSGRDIYCVVARTPSDQPRTSQTPINGTIKRQENKVDVTMIDLGTWLDECRRGVPQALEAMFAPSPDMDHLGALRARYRATSQVWDTYLRTIKAFAHSDEDDPRSTKRKVHSLRLAWNLYEMRETGRFEPALHPMQVDQYRKVVEAYEGDPAGLYDVAMAVAWK